MARTFEVLLVEDNPADARLTEEAFGDGKIPSRLHVVQDGAEAMTYLHRQGTYQNVPRPDVVLLDLNLPKKDGREVLAEMKTHPDLKRIPVVVLTTSEAEQDVLKSYDLHANCYVPKPGDLERYLAAIRSIREFWLSTAKLPP